MKRNLLAYFLESKIWKAYVEAVVDNYVVWINEDPDRARRMMASRGSNHKGYTVSEHIYDMVDCVYKSSLKSKTKLQLYKELDELEIYHYEYGTIEDYV